MQVPVDAQFGFHITDDVRLLRERERERCAN